MHSVYIICTAMCWNGVQTGMANTLQLLKPTQQALQQVGPALFVAVARTSMPRNAVQPDAIPTARASPSAISGFVWLSLRSFDELKVGKGKVIKYKGEINQFLLWQCRSLEMINPECKPFWLKPPLGVE